MKCRLCGAEIPGDAYFCSECGALTASAENEKKPPQPKPTAEPVPPAAAPMPPPAATPMPSPATANGALMWTTCHHCGAQVREGTTFCPNCGNRIGNIAAPAMSGQTSPQSNKLLIVLISSGTALLAALIIAIVVIVAYSADSEPSVTAAPIPTQMPTMAPIETIAPTLTPTAIPTIRPTTRPTSKPTARPTTAPKQEQKETSAIPNPSYSRFTSNEYGFSINYPSHFKAYNDGGTITLHTVESPDGQARELIAAVPANGETVDSSYNSYVSSHSGSIEYHNKGSNFYAINILSGNTEYYKYCKFGNGNMYWFEFISPHSQHDVYDVYINDIYNSISIDGVTIKK